MFYIFECFEAGDSLGEISTALADMEIVSSTGKAAWSRETISKSYQTHTIRCKGSSVVGKPRKLKFGEDAMQWMKKWLEVRGEDDCPYMFVVKYKNGKTRQVGEDTFNGWCKKFEKIIGRRCHPHQFRESRATNIVVYEHKSAEVAQKLLGHNDVSTTKNHYIIRNDEIDESDEAFI